MRLLELIKYFWFVVIYILLFNALRVGRELNNVNEEDIE